MRRFRAMIDNADHFLCAKLARYWPQVVVAALGAHVDPYLLGALVMVESNANTYAMRVERGFWARYGARIVRAVRASAATEDDRWITYPDVASASYGLCQIMYPVALEQGIRLAYPTELCDPQLNLDLGARILGQHLAKQSGDTRAALLRYNGGGNPDYPTAVIAWRTHLLHTPVQLPTPKIGREEI